MNNIIIAYLWFISSIGLSSFHHSIKKIILFEIPVIQVSFMRMMLALVFLFVSKNIMIFFKVNKKDKENKKINNDKFREDNSQIENLDLINEDNVSNNIFNENSKWMMFKSMFIEEFGTKFIIQHIIRGFMFCIAVYIWNLSLKIFPIVLVSIIGFTSPVWVLLFSRMFLREKIDTNLIFSVLLGFAGILFILFFDSHFVNDSIMNIFYGIESHYYYFLILLFSMVIFAGLDVFNKGLLNKNETPFKMVFYSTLFATMFNSYYGITEWQEVTSNRVYYIILFISVSAIYTNYGIMRAFKLVNVSSITPLRYLEVLMSAIFAYLFFKEVPSNSIYIGGSMVLLSSYFITKHNNNLKEEKKCSK